MAKMGCYCGATMSNVNCPSENIIYIMSRHRVETALKHDKHIKLIDFLTNWDVLSDSKKAFISEEFDFWYCTECKRVYQSEIIIGGNKLAAYKPSAEYPFAALSDILQMEELVVFTDIEEDAAIEQDPDITLERFLNALGRNRYFLSNDRKYVYAYDSVSRQVAFVYEAEELLV